jgi:glycine dehydrogenase subunit 2
LKDETTVSALNIAKRLLDYGIHAPTAYFPLIVDEALMIEPTETVGKEDLDHFVDVMQKISDEAYTKPETVLKAPQNTAVTRLDEVKASHPRTMTLSWMMYQKRKQATDLG